MLGSQQYLLNTANKLTPGGRLAQGIMNKMSESGTTNRINSALKKKNSSSPIWRFRGETIYSKILPRL